MQLSKDLRRGMEREPDLSRIRLPERLWRPLLIVFILGAVLILVPMLWLQLLRGSKAVYNEMRGAPAVALVAGQRIYQGIEVTGPLFCVVYAPLTYLAYAPIAWLREPQSALLMGSSIALAFYTSPLIYLLLRFRKEPNRSLASAAAMALLFFAFTLSSPAL